MWGLIEALFVVAIGAKLFPWIVAAIALMVVIWFVWRLIRRHDQAVDAERQRAAGLAARADEQYARYMAGDPLAMYGEYPPADL